MGQVEIARWRKIGIKRCGGRNRKANEENAAERKHSEFYGVQLRNCRARSNGFY